VNATTPISYCIQPIRPEAHLFRVTCSVPVPDPEGQMFTLPAWIPGSYMIRDFARNVIWLTASNAAGAVDVVKTDKQSWRCAPCAGPLTVEYEVYAWDLSVRAAHLDTTHGYFNGTSVFVAAQNFEDRPCRVEILPPEGQAYCDWRVATALPRDGAALHGFGTYRAGNYDELVDHPVEMGCFVRASFDVAGVAHDVVITGRQHVDLERLCRDTQAICRHHVDFFGELPAMDRYVFLFMVVGEGYGGLEHRASCSLMCSRADLPRVGDDKVDEGYRQLLGLISHEYFHTWNVKRIKPAAFMPYDLSRETHTRQLWAFEGFTSYYDELALVRSGRIEAPSYLELLGQTLTRVWRGRGRFKQSVAESSFDAWTKFYKQDENAPNAIVSYYTKGAMVALALDLTLRRGTDGAKSLDDVMRALWSDYGGPEVGVPEHGVERVAAAVSGLDLDSFFARAVYGTEDLELTPLLEHFGLDFRLRAPDSSKDKGGKPAANPERKKPLLVLGIRLDPNGDAARISHVLDGGGAQDAGLAAGDEIVAVDGFRVRARSLEALLQGYSPGERLRIHAFRRDELMEFEVTLKPAAPDTCVVTLLDDVDPGTRRRRDAWLYGNRQ